jgi:FAD binding domain/Berberine and berberine like
MDLITPDSPAYEAARKPAIPRFHDARPAAVASCGDPDDVAAALAHARGSGLPVAVRSGGHSFAGSSSTTGLVIDVTPMNGVEVRDGTATVGAGARLGQVYDALLEHDLTIPAGCGPDVGVSGLTLGGGFGILGRQHGLTCDQLLAADVVLADGRLARCDEGHDADLFWALRGAGGGRLGVVTSLTFRTVTPPPATGFHLVWPIEHAAALIEAWQSWSPHAPDQLAASLLATSVVNVFGSMLGSEADTQALLDAFVATVGVDPETATLRPGPFRETKRWLTELGLGDERPGGVMFSKSEYFRGPLPSEAIAALVENLERDRAAGETRELDFSPWAGAYNRVPADATAFPHRAELFVLKHAAVVAGDASAAEREAARSWVRRSWETVHPWGSGGVYPNFPDPELYDPPLAYWGPNRERVDKVAARYDPEGLFRT